MSFFWKNFEFFFTNQNKIKYWDDTDTGLRTVLNVRPEDLPKVFANGRSLDETFDFNVLRPKDLWMKKLDFYFKFLFCFYLGGLVKSRFSFPILLLLLFNVCDWKINELKNLIFIKFFVFFSGVGKGRGGLCWLLAVQVNIFINIITMDPIDIVFWSDISCELFWKERFFFWDFSKILQRMIITFSQHFFNLSHWRTSLRIISATTKSNLFNKQKKNVFFKMNSYQNNFNAYFPKQWWTIFRNVFFQSLLW